MKSSNIYVPDLSASNYTRSFGERDMDTVLPIIGAAALLFVGLAMLHSDTVIILLMMREARRMAATLPEADRERWLNDALSQMGKAVEEKSARSSTG